MSVVSSIAACNIEPIVPHVTVWSFLKTKIVFFNIISLCAVCVLVAAYIFFVNGDIAKGYKIRELETRLSELELQNQQIEVVARESQSLEHVAYSVKMMGFVKAKMPTYIHAGAPSVAMAK